MVGKGQPEDAQEKLLAPSPPQGIQSLRVCCSSREHSPPASHQESDGNGLQAGFAFRKKTTHRLTKSVSSPDTQSSALKAMRP